MPPRLSLHLMLLRILRQMLLVLDGVVGARLEGMRARWAALPVGHRRRARLAAEIRRLGRLRALLADPDVLEDAGFRGKAAEVARVCNDAGRRAMPRRRIQPAPLARLRGAVPVAMPRPEEGRCIACIAAA